LSFIFIDTKYFWYSGYSKAKYGISLFSIRYPLFSLLQSTKLRQVELSSISHMLTSLKITNFQALSNNNLGFNHFFTIMFHHFHIHLYHLYNTAALGVYHISLGVVYTYFTRSFLVVKSRSPSQSKSYIIVLSCTKSSLSDIIFDITSKVTSSPTSTVVLSSFSVTSGISGLLVSGGKNTIGQFHIIFSLEFLPSSLSYIVTPNINSQGIFGKEKYA